MADPPLTLWCILIALVVPFIVGLPLCWLLVGRRSLVERDYLLAPFLGIAIVVLVLQNLVWLDLPIHLTAPVAWLAALAAWALLWRAGQWRALLNAALRVPLAVFVGVYLVSGVGLLLVIAVLFARRGLLGLFEDIGRYISKKRTS